MEVLELLHMDHEDGCTCGMGIVVLCSYAEEKNRNRFRRRPHRANGFARHPSLFAGSQRKMERPYASRAQ
jgi:hypothetical protein